MAQYSILLAILALRLTLQKIKCAAQNGGIVRIQNTVALVVSVLALVFAFVVLGLILQGSEPADIPVDTINKAEAIELLEEAEKAKRRRT